MSETTPVIIEKLEEEILEKKKQLAGLRRSLPRETIGEYNLTAHDGSAIPFANLFGEKDRLILIHNMGSSCSYCTRWADGFNGIVPWLEEKAAFVLVSPDDPKHQAKFAEERGWTFPMLSATGSTFTRDMGFENDDGSPAPGVSTFVKLTDGTIQRVASASFGPGDDFCSIFHFFDLLPED